MKKKELEVSKPGEPNGGQKSKKLPGSRSSSLAGSEGAGEALRLLTIGQMAARLELEHVLTLAGTRSQEPGFIDAAGVSTQCVDSSPPGEKHSQSRLIWLGENLINHPPRAPKRAPCPEKEERESMTLNRIILGVVAALTLTLSGCSNLDCDGSGTSCVCENGDCAQKCSGGNCQLSCTGENCKLDCPGGNCQLACVGATSCELTSCTSNCSVSCGGAATCSSSCKNMASGCTTAP